MTNCVICGQPQGTTPFMYPPDNAWDTDNGAHVGCVNKRRVQEAAKSGYNSQPPTENEREQPDGEAGDHRKPDPDFQV